MRRHTIEGQRMLDSVGGVLARVGVIVRASHESYDGSGYPDRLAGNAIPIEARICSACDAFSAMTTERAYRPRCQSRAPWQSSSAAPEPSSTPASSPLYKRS